MHADYASRIRELMMADPPIISISNPLEKIQVPIVYGLAQENSLYIYTIISNGPLNMADINSLTDFSTTSHPLWDVPVAPFGDKGNHIAFSKESPRVQIDGEFTLEQMETILEYMKSRQY